MTNSANLEADHSGSSTPVFFGLPEVYVSQGDHIAHFFRGNQERLDVLVPFLQAGLQAGDQCVLVGESSASSLITDHLGTQGTDVAAALRSGQLQSSDGGSSVADMSAMFEDIIGRAKSAERETIRIGGDMTWALGKLPTTEKLLEWEAFYDQYVGHRAGFVALCQYDHSRFDGSTIMYALQTHPLSIIGDIVQENPFYRSPEEILQELAQRSS
ncbi:MAG: MEDS domain-containing protein [Dehalococcoidia bacterium]